MDPLHVSCAVEGGYVIHSAALLHSVLANAGERPVQVHYLHGPGFPGRSAELLQEMVTGLDGRISFLEIADEQVADLPHSAQFTSAMWHRTFLDELLPGVDRVLYLDVDTLVLDELEPLWTTHLGDSYLGAVTNVFEHRFLHRPADLGLPGPEVYFNSGVLLLNLDSMRRDGSGAAVRAYAREQGPQLEWPDQDALNVVLGRRRVPLHPRWNAMNSVMNFFWAPEVFPPGEVDLARRLPGIRHFEGPGPNKPWHYLCNQAFREAYAEHRRHTPWPRVRREGVTPANVLRRLRWAARGERPTP